MITVPTCWRLACAFLTVCASTVRSQPYDFTTVAGLAGSGGTADGTNASARFTALAGATVDAAGNAYVADGNAIRKVAPLGADWVVSTLAGSIGSHSFVDGTNAVAQFNYPQGVAVGGAGTLYVADTYNHAIRTVAPVGVNWVVTTIAGPTPPTIAYGADDGTNNVARFRKPYGIAVDSAGVLYIADTFNHTIRKVAPSGANWVVTTLAGWSTTSGNLDGTGTNAQFMAPAGIAVGAGGTLYVADFAGNTIRKITPIGPNWVVSTLAGLGGSAGTNDGLGSAARFNQPFGIVVDGMNHVIVADSANHTIRRITPAGSVTTIGGLPGVAGSANGIGRSARFDVPQGLGLESSGKIYVTEYGGDPLTAGGYTVRQGQVAALLQIDYVNNRVVLSWPLGLTGFVAQAAHSLPTPSWNPVPTNPWVSGDYWTLTDTNPINPSLYRLAK